MRRADFLAAGVVSTFGAGLFTGLAPAASLAGRWLLPAFAVAAVVGHLAALSTSERPLDTVPGTLRRLVFAVGALGRLAAAVAVAGTFGRYVAPSHPELGAVTLAVVVTAVAVAAPRPPVPVVQLAALAVVGCLALVVGACFAIAPVAPAVAVEEVGTTPLGFVASVGLLTVCFLGAPPAPRPVVDVNLPPVIETHPPRRTSADDPPPTTGDTEIDSPPLADGSPPVAEGSPPAADGAEKDQPPAAGDPQRMGVGSVPVPDGSLPATGGSSAVAGGDEEDRRSAAGGSLPASIRSVSTTNSLSVPGGRVRVLMVSGVVGVVGLAVGAAVLRQLGVPRLAVSPVPLRDALAAADAGALEPLLVVGVAVACGFCLLGIVCGLGVGAGLPVMRVRVVTGGVVAVGAVLVAPVAALGVAAVLLLGDAALRFVAVRHRRRR